MRLDVQQVQASKRVVTKGLATIAERPAETREGVCVRLESQQDGATAGRCVSARTLDTERGNAAVRRVSSGLPSDVAEKLANGAQENGLQHLCACSARSVSPIKNKLLRELMQGRGANE